ncbi:tetratricopeptide repeat family protein [Nitzschia inconspicua]|uniref:Tetratricopeptide repeat family protein n=1 Tax=Nitzschia inconspicua TaxID=303405 RepID=A0A9K3LE95_9STRA|nr:tetratricopeptide repeat family protein [Nitzschia inconspicua]
MPCEEYDYIFGFGSIMNTSTHAPWLQPSGKGNDVLNKRSSSSSSFSVLPGAVVTLTKEFGYERRWNFRSSTGFTALGVSKAKSVNAASDINGVLFQVPKEMMPGFDRREVGYEKVPIPIEFLRFDNGDLVENDRNGNSCLCYKQLNSNSRLWLYVPLPSFSKPADENHPLLQSYVDTVLQGCLEWGGERMADIFIQTTGGWSTYFLNDTPSSRRPWLFRKDYSTIDRLLQKYASKTHFGNRKHPEEFSSVFHRRMKGTWSIPRRNKNFTGRERELRDLRTRFAEGEGYGVQDADGSGQHSVVKVEVAGMGGVGKTQLVTEYCYRQYPSDYGLVVWLNAETAESLVADYQQLLLDLAQEDASEMTILRPHDGANSSVCSGSSSTVANISGGSVSAHDTDEIVREVKARLFRSQVPWLLVFDNLEDRRLLKSFAPRGAGTRGHILVTTRLFEAGDGQGDASGNLSLGCFSPCESLELLQRATGSRNIEGEENQIAAKEVCIRLGHLPLALSTAAAYMLRCDVNCMEYLQRYHLSERNGQSLLRHGKLQDYPLSVASSLSLSLVAIKKESTVAHDILHVLCFLGPDLITKKLLRCLLQTRIEQQVSGRSTVHHTLISKSTKTLSLAFGFLTLVSTIALVAGPLNSTKQKSAVVALTALSAGSFLAFFSGVNNDIMGFNDIDVEPPTRSFSFTSVEFEQADLAWDILKSFSLLSVKDGRGNMHRLLSQALRSSQSEPDAIANLRICLDTMEGMWTFRAEETGSWKEAFQILEHVKAVVTHCQLYKLDCRDILKAGRLSTEAGLFTAMSLNAFIDAQQSFELALSLYDSASNACDSPAFQKARAEALHELGRVFRYQEKYAESQRSLQDALQIYEKFAPKDIASQCRVADNLHELGVLEVKKHNLGAATEFLQQSLELRRNSGNQYLNDAKSAATLHQLAAITVARKPPSLAQAESLLQEALGLSRQIAQRAATLKQLARVTIRQGNLDLAESYLKQALDLYKELYGDNRNHMNVAAVKFQQGALALQREQLEDAWTHFSECLRMRRSVYAYAKPVGGENDQDPTHLEVSCVLRELARVAVSQEYYQKALETLKSEREILQRLEETSEHHTERIYQARLTNLTWLKKCAKEIGNDDLANQFANERSSLKKTVSKSVKEEEEEHKRREISEPLAAAALRCRIAARRVALEQDKSGSKKEDLNFYLKELSQKIDFAEADPLKDHVIKFRDEVVQWKDRPAAKRRCPMLQACDKMRDVLRANGHQISDTISSL